MMIAHFFHQFGRENSFLTNYGIDFHGFLYKQMIKHGDPLTLSSSVIFCFLVKCLKNYQMACHEMWLTQNTRNDVIKCHV